MGKDIYNSAGLLVLDLDGTLCEQTAGGEAYWSARPRKDVIARVNSYYGKGWYITIHTARGMRTCNSDVVEVERLYRYGTKLWLDMNGVMYDKLIFGKPPGDIYVDDRGLTPEEFTKHE